MNGVTIDRGGTVYTVDVIHHTVYKVPPLGAATLLSGDGQPGYLDDTIPHGTFNEPSDITVDASGNLSIADRNTFQ